MARWLGAALCSLALLAQGVGDAGARPRAHVEDSVPRDPARAHEGAFLRLMAGFTHVVVHMPLDEKVSGDGGEVAAAIGGNVIPGFILHGDAALSLALDPTSATGAVDEETRERALLFRVGGGFTAFFPIEFFLSMRFGVAMVNVGERMFDDAHGSQLGGFPALVPNSVSTMVGKEWWVSDGWALGIAAEGSWSKLYVREGDSEYWWTASSFALLGSATYD